MADERDTATPRTQALDDEVQRPFDRLYRDQARALQRRIRVRVGSSEDASDIVQEAFTRLLGASNGPSLRNPAAFLNRIVRNLLIDRSRRRAAQPLMVHLETEAVIAVPPDQAHALELKQMRQRYRDIVDALPPRTREVFLLHRVQELGYREIAERLGISIRTVEWHVAQAIYRIGKDLDPQ